MFTLGEEEMSESERQLVNLGMLRVYAKGFAAGTCT